MDSEPNGAVALPQKVELRQRIQAMVIAYAWAGHFHRYPNRLPTRTGSPT